MYMYILNLRSHNPTPSDRGDQQFVEPSLERVQIDVTFTERGIQRVLLPFEDDEVGREDTERVVLSLSNVTFPGRVDFSPHRQIEVGVSDDDGKWMKTVRLIAVSSYIIIPMYGSLEMNTRLSALLFLISKICRHILAGPVYMTSYC